MCYACGDHGQSTSVKFSLRQPAIALIVLSSVAILMDLAILNAIRKASIADSPRMVGEREPQRRSGKSIVSGAIANGGLLAIHMFVLFGSVNMLRLRSYSSARMAAIVSLIPFCSPGVLLGVPFGYWALRILRRDDVKAAFPPTSPLVTRMADK